MLPNEIVDAVVDTVSGIRAKDHVASIARYHRIQASPGYHEALQFVKNEVSKISDTEIQIYEYNADGETSVETWVAPMGWTPKFGRLELLEPEKRTLADFDAEPISLVAHSTNANIESEVIHVGKGLEDTDYEGKDVSGKIVLSETRARYAHRIACIKKGAAGILSYVAPSGIDELAHLRRYDAIWPSPGEYREAKFGFSLTQADGIKIKNWLEEGTKVKVHAEVKASLEPAKFEVLSALIKGEDTEKEVWLFAHLCHPHPGANDNASGSGALLETLRTISLLMQRGILNKPQHSIRFLWGPEWSGTIQLIHNEPQILSKCCAMINLDMVGADPCKSGSTLHLFRTPYSLPTTLNCLVRYWVDKESKRKIKRSSGGTMCPLYWNYDTYSAGSDHFMFTDKTVGIPAIMLNQFPDKFYHTSTDTPDKIDPTPMGLAVRVAVLSALSYAFPKLVCKEALLTLCRNESIELIERVSLDAVTELSRCLGEPDLIYPRALRWLGMAHELGQATLDIAAEEWKLISEQEAIRDALKTSLQMIYTTEMVAARKAYEGACAEVGLEAMKDDQLILKAPGLGLEIKRRFKHALSPSKVIEKLPERTSRYLELREKDKRIFDRVDEMLNLAVDWVPLEDIWDRLCFQFGEFEPKILLELVEDLSKIGLLESRSV